MNHQTDEEREFESLLAYLRDVRSFDFTGYKRASLRRRVTKRMHEVGIDSFPAYRDHLEVHPEEFTALFNTILINVTGFFRDPAAWECLQQEVIPQVVGDGRAPLRVWSAGCASGEEAYTLAIVLAEALGPEAFRQRVKIYATDVDDEALTHARHAAYTAQQLEGVPEHLRKRYFEENDHGFLVRPELRRAVIFGRHDLVHDAPISRVDLLSCRNTLMYLNAETQARVLSRLHFATTDGGFLFLGKVEMLAKHQELFSPVNLRLRIFRKEPQEGLRERLLVMAEAQHPSATPRDAPLSLLGTAFDRSPVAAVVLNDRGVLEHANQRAESLLGLGGADLGRLFQDLELSYRPVELRSHLKQAMTEGTPVSISEVERAGSPNADPSYLDIEIIPLLEDGGRCLGALLTFADVTRHRDLQTELEHANLKLSNAYEELQSGNEELETTNEELQSTNEELETTNEELQSTNEELETMNEELQSTNEELQTMNTELQDRTADLDQVNAFLESILSSLDAAVIVVDRDLRVREWSHRAFDQWGLRFEEVRGESLPNLDIGLPVDELTDPLRSVLAGEPAPPVRVQAVNRRGRWTSFQVTCTPLRGRDSHVEGAIVLIEELPDEGGEHDDGF